MKTITPAYTKFLTVPGSSGHAGRALVSVLVAVAVLAAACGRDSRESLDTGVDVARASSAVGAGTLARDVVQLTGAVAGAGVRDVSQGSVTAVLAQPGGFGDVGEGEFYSVPVVELAALGVFAGTGCGEGFCPDEPIDRKTMAVWTVRVVTGDEPPPVSRTGFGDVDAGSFYAPFVERMAALGITQGCGDGSGFCPDDTVTRAQMAVFLSRAFSLPDGPDPGFSDVAAGAWYAAEVARLAASGITRGCGDGTVFCPDQATSRAQMATFLHRAIAYDDRPEPEPAVVVLGELPAEATVAASARQIQVSWPQAPRVTGSPVAGYEVQWRSGTQGWDAPRRRVVTALSYVIDGLFDGTLYTVRVRPAAVQSASVDGASIVAGAGSDPAAEVARPPARVDESLEISTTAGPVRFMMDSEPVWPATIALPVDTTGLPEDRSVFLMYHYDPLGLWLPVSGATLDRENSTVHAQVGFTGTFTAIAGSEVAALTDSDINDIGEALRAVVAGETAAGNAAFRLLNGDPAELRRLEPLHVVQYAQAILDAAENLPAGSLPEWMLLMLTVVAQAGTPDAPATTGTQTTRSQTASTTPVTLLAANSPAPAAVDTPHSASGAQAALALPGFIEDALSWHTYQIQDKVAGNRGDAPQCDGTLPPWVPRIVTAEDRNAPVLVCGEEVDGSLHLKIASNRGYPMRATVDFPFEVADAGFNSDWGEQLATLLAGHNQVFLRETGTISLEIPHDSRTLDEVLRIEFQPDPVAYFYSTMLEIGLGALPLPPSLSQAILECILPVLLALDSLVRNLVTGAYERTPLGSIRLQRDIEVLERAQDSQIVCITKELELSAYTEFRASGQSIIDELLGISLLTYLDIGASLSFNFADLISDGSIEEVSTVHIRIDPTPPTQPRIGYQELNLDRGGYDLYVANADGTGTTNITTNAIDDPSGDPRDLIWGWSPDGARIAYHDADRGGLYVTNADGTGTTTITTNFVSQFAPYSAWSPDGTRIAYQEQDPDTRRRGLYVANADGTGTTTITTSFLGGNVWWSPDGTRIAYTIAYTEVGPDTRRRTLRDLYVANADGTGTTTITTRTYTIVQRDWLWSPDGTRIAYRHRDPDTRRWGLYVANADGTGTTTITTTTDGLSWRPWRPWQSWSPDGTRIAYAEVDPDTRRWDLYVANADGTGTTTITTNRANGEWLWSPDGTRIAYQEWDRDPRRWGLHVANADGTGTTTITTNPLGGNVWWSPDGTRIAYKEQQDPDTSRAVLYVVNADGTGTTTITTLMDRIVDSDFVWSPDGTRIAYEQGAGRGGLYVAKADGTGTNTISTSVAASYWGWSPDGTRIAYRARNPDTRRYDLYVANADGTGTTTISTNFASSSAWAWSPGVMDARSMNGGG